MIDTKKYPQTYEYSRKDFFGKPICPDLIHVTRFQSGDVVLRNALYLVDVKNEVFDIAITRYAILQSQPSLDNMEYRHNKTEFYKELKDKYTATPVYLLKGTEMSTPGIFIKFSPLIKSYLQSFTYGKVMLRMTKGEVTEIIAVLDIFRYVKLLKDRGLNPTSSELTHFIGDVLYEDNCVTSVRRPRWIPSDDEAIRIVEFRTKPSISQIEMPDQQYANNGDMCGL